MNKDRANQIFAAASFMFGNVRALGDTSKHMTAAEVAEVRALWKTMPGHTSFNDALRRIARGR